MLLFKSVAALISALLLWSAFPPSSQSASAWIALIPLLFLIRNSSPKHAFGWAWLSGTFFWCATLSWFPAIIKNGGPWILVVLGQVALAAWCALFFGAFGFASARVWAWAGTGSSMKRILAVTVMDPLLWAGTEYLRGKLLTGFAWNFLGVSQVNNLPVVQIASVLGVYGVSALIILFNGAITSIASRTLEPFLARLKRQPFQAPKFPERLLRSAESLLPLACVLACWVWGFNRINLWMRTEQTHPMWRIAIIQPNIPCYFNNNKELIQQQREIFNEQNQMVKLASPDLTIWSETSVPYLMPESPSALAFVKRGAANTGSPILAGVMEAEKTAVSRSAPEGVHYYNAAWLFDRDGKPLSTYRKQHLVPFGEFIPLDKTFPILQKLAPTGVSCMPGKAPSVMKLTRANGDTLHIGALICFEDTIPDLSRHSVRAGARILALVTNDAWFNGSIEPIQHLHQAVFRSIENGVPMVRCANSGVSATVDPVGRTTALTSSKHLADFHGFLVRPLHVPATPLPALYTVCGDFLLAIPGMILLLGLLAPSVFRVGRSFFNKFHKT
jgi:apolipoprotein N-acyltransferase